MISHIETCSTVKQVRLSKNGREKVANKTTRLKTAASLFTLGAVLITISACNPQNQKVADKALHINLNASYDMLTNCVVGTEYMFNGYLVQGSTFPKPWIQVKGNPYQQDQTFQRFEISATPTYQAQWNDKIDPAPDSNTSVIVFEKIPKNYIRIGTKVVVDATCKDVNNNGQTFLQGNVTPEETIATRYIQGLAMESIAHSRRST